MFFYFQLYNKFTLVADKEREDKDLKEAEEDRKFREKQKEFGDIFNRYRTSSPLKYIKQA